MNKLLLLGLVPLLVSLPTSAQGKKKSDPPRPAHSPQAVERPARPEGPTCDMKHVIDGFVCDLDHRTYTPADLVDPVECYVCPKCGALQKTAGNCKSCGTACEPGHAPPMVCPICLKAPTPRKLCEKTRYECPDCGADAGKPGDCPKCQVPLEKVVSLAPIDFVCPQCHHVSTQPGNCTTEDCKRKGKPLMAVCSMAGTPPHVVAERASAKADEGKKQKPSSDGPHSKKKAKKKEGGHKKKGDGSVVSS